MTVDPEHSALQAALREIALITQRLRALGDLASLSRFGEPEAGASIAAMYGHTLLTTTEMRTVDQLSRMPGGHKLVRTYLTCSSVPRVSDVEHARDRSESGSLCADPTDRSTATRALSTT